MLMGTVAALPLTSCGDDDDDPVIDNPGGGEIVTPDNQRLLVTSVGGYKFLYNSDNLFAGVENEFKVDYLTNTITGIGDEADPDESITFNYDSNGHVTAMRYVERGQDSNYYEEVKYAFSYSQFGYLVKMTATGEGSEVDEGVAVKWTSTMEMDLSWKDGELLSSEARFNMVENGSVEKETYKYTFTQGDNNPLAQTSLGYAINFAEMDDEFSWMALGGMLGTAPTKFPREVTVDYTDEDGNHQETYIFAYDIAQNLTINNEKVNGKTYRYTYTPVSSSTSKVKLFDGMKKARKMR